MYLEQNFYNMLFNYDIYYDILLIAIYLLEIVLGF